MKLAVLLISSILVFGQGRPQAQGTKGKGHGGGSGGGNPPPIVSCIYPSFCVGSAGSSFSAPLPASFSFPFSSTLDCSLSACNALQDVYTNRASVFSETEILSVSFSISAPNAVFGWWQSAWGNVPGGGCTAPANFSGFLYSASGNRYFSWPNYFTLKDTEGAPTVFNVPLQSQYWIDATGHNNSPSFATDLSQITWYGIVFGGGCFADKGVFRTSLDPATMAVQSITIQ